MIEIVAVCLAALGGAGLAWDGWRRYLEATSTKRYEDLDRVVVQHHRDIENLKAKVTSIASMRGSSRR